METTTFNVPSISCNVCASKIQEGLKGIKGINNVEVDMKTKMVNVEYNPGDINAKDIIEKVSSMGYEVVQ